jgi:hypothetical protein
MPLPALKPVQIAYYVPDPAAAAVRFAERFGWGPFYLMEHIPVASCLYRGRPEVFDHSSAYGQAGEMMVELITHHGPGPSALRDMYSAQESGVHHVAYFVPVLAQTLKTCREQGFEVAMEARTTGGVEFAMVDARADVGHMLEFYEPREDLAQFYAFVKQKSQGWDGREPLRRLNL